MMTRSMMNKAAYKLLAICLPVLVVLTGCSDFKAHSVQAGQPKASITVQDQDGQILLQQDFSFDDGCTVADALLFAAQQADVPVARSGVGAAVYITSINGLAAFDYGAQSGWVYYVNDVFADVGCGGRTVQNGDEILWKYVTEYVDGGETQ